MSVVLLEDAIVHYEVLGRGRPVIFLHGWVGSWRYWISSMQVASTSFRAYAFDLWGFGDTAKKVDGYTLEAQAALLDSFLNEMGMGKVALVGHGWGGLVALKFASESAEKVDRLMVSNCPLDMKKLNDRKLKEVAKGLANSLTSEAEKTDQNAKKYSLENDKAIDLFNNVNRQHTTCLLVSGGQDPVIALPTSNETGLLSDSGFHINIESAGHFPMLDSAATFNRLLTDFLALDTGLSIKGLGLKEEWQRRVR